MPRNITTGSTKVYVDRATMNFIAERTNADLTNAINRYKSLIFFFEGSKKSKYPALNVIRIIVDDLTAVLQVNIV